MKLNKAWFHAHATELGIGGAGSGLALLLYLRSRSQAASSTSSTTPTTQTYLNPAATDDTGVTDLASQVGTLTGQVQDLVNGSGSSSLSTTPATFVPPSGQTFAGSGYGGLATVGSYSGQTYSGVQEAAANAIQHSGGETYYEPTPGNFIAVTPTNVGSLLPGTPQYELNG